MLIRPTVKLVLLTLTAVHVHGSPRAKPGFSFVTPSQLAPRDPVRGCGTLVDGDGIGYTMISNEQCNAIDDVAESINIGTGCVCVVFSKAGCGLDEPKHWAYLSAGPRVNRSLKGGEVKWYQCSTDEKWMNVNAMLFYLVN